MAVLDTLQNKAAAEPDHQVAVHGLLHDVLDMIAAAAHTDMNEVRKVIAAVRDCVPALAEAVVAKGPPPAAPLPVESAAKPLTDKESERRNDLLDKKKRTDDEQAELDGLNARMFA